MSSSDAQPPLSRRQARERERAASTGDQPVAPPPSVAPASQPAAETFRRRPGSHVAPASAAPAQAPVPSVPPASATEIVPGSGGLTRRQMRQMREAQEQAIRPVPLQSPTPQSSDRTVEDVIGTVQQLEHQGERGDAAHAPGIAERPESVAPTDAPAHPAPTDSTSLPTQAMSLPTADATPVAQSVPSAPLAPSGFAGAAGVAPSSTEEPDDDRADPAESEVDLDPAAVEQATAADGSPDDIEPLGQAAAHAEEPRRHRSTWSAHQDDAAPSPADRTPGVFPLDLDEDDTNEVPIVEPADVPDRGPAGRVEPKPVTTAYEPPAGHWSLQGEDHHDAEVHDTETGVRRVADANTSALILPNSALGDVTGALNATGEVIITGSIDLPKSLSSTGSHRPIDGAEVDRLLEQQDEQPETDASPVRASRAVSSHTSTRQVVLAAAKPKESRTPLVLGITAGALGLAAIGVVIGALVSTGIL